ncbi:hypothetical protein HK096_010696 [Nowakowskiella sp. JEL0078]|nr:hypothetical protein HK096_010696 [Nowakowskiella sp. JEL0078]
MYSSSRISKSLVVRFSFFLVVFCFCVLAFSNSANADVANPIVDQTDQAIPPEMKILSEDDLAAVSKSSEKFAFEAEVNRMMKMIINSLYKSKEIFLRELISNASDALDKIRFLSLTNTDALKSNPDLKITIVADVEKKTLTLRDTGIGMTKDDLRKNLGTLAKSGTAEFMAQMENKTADMGLIGQFGVGFYSVFLVADRVTVVSKSNDDKQYIWQSDAISDFTIVEDPRGNTLGRGTEITMHLKDDALEFVEDAKLNELIKKYSEFINFEIYLWAKHTKTEEIPIEPTEEDDKKADDLEVEDIDDEKKDVKPKTESVTKSWRDWELMNSQKPIWIRPTKEVTDQEYKDFYKSFFKEYSDPISWIHFKAEGEIDFKSILFIPDKLPTGFYENIHKHLNNVKLFVKRVFITDELLDLLPKYLSFIKGLVDSDDLPLNVSRETLQHSTLLKLIRKKVIGKAISLIESLAKNEVNYEKFFEEYGTSLKLGVIEDQAHKNKLTKLLRFPSSSTEKLTGFVDYVKRMKKNQPQIYYLTGGNMEEIKNSPFAEKLIARGYEVLYMPNPMDEYLVENLRKYDKFPLQNVAKAGLVYGDEDDDDKKEFDQLTEEFKPLAEWLKSALFDYVDKVTISNLLTKSPCAVVASEYGRSGNMERILMSQAMKGSEDPMQTYYNKMKKTLQINPYHPIMENLLEKINSDKVDLDTKATAMVLYEMSLLRSGFVIRDIEGFSGRVENVVRNNLGVEVGKEALVDVKPAPEFEDVKDKVKETEDNYGEDTDELEEPEVLHDEL